jgi:type IV pilus assembly protein PilF
MFKVCLLTAVCLMVSACASSSPQEVNLAQLDVNLGLDALKSGDPLNAKAKLLEALQLAPQDAEVQAAWGYYLAAMHDVGEARAAYQDAINLAPNDPEIQNDYAVFLYQQKEYSEALIYFLRAAHNEHYLYSGLAYENASLAALHLGDTAHAAAYHQEALTELPELQEQ